MKKIDEVIINAQYGKPICFKLVSGGAHRINDKFFDAYSKIPYIRFRTEKDPEKNVIVWPSTHEYVKYKVPAEYEKGVTTEPPYYVVLKYPENLNLIGLSPISLPNLCKINDDLEIVALLGDE